MAPKRRVARRADIASCILPSIETDGNPTSPASGNSAETAYPQTYRSWTPGPSKVLNPRDEEEVADWTKKCLAWDRKHFGERYYELNKAYLHEKDHLQNTLKYYDMWKEMRHIEAEKTTEHEREKKAALGDQYIPNPFVRLSKSDDGNDSDMDSNSDKSEPMPDDPWERLEYARRHLHLYQSEEEYQAAGARIEASLKAQQEEKERKRVEDAERMAIRWLANTDYSEYQRLWRRHGLRYGEGLTDEQIDDLDRKEAAAQERGAWYPSGLSDPLQNSLHFLERIKGKTQEQIDAMEREEAAARERRKNEPPMKSIFSRLTQEELDAKHRAWDALGLSKERQAELVRVFGLKPESELEPEPGMADAPASERVSQPRASSPRPPKDISRRTHGGRITKSTAQIQSAANRGTRSLQTAPTPAEAPMPNRWSKRQKASDMIDEPEDSAVQFTRKTRKLQPRVDKKKADAVQDIDDRVLQSKPHNTRQRKVYKQERESRRLAGDLPEYGMLPKRGAPAPLYQPPSNTRKPNPSGPRSRASSKKKSIAVKGAKPRGISKSGREGTNRLKRSKKRPEG